MFYDKFKAKLSSRQPSGMQVGIQGIDDGGKKRKDTKMLAIAAVIVLGFIGLLFWVFSGSSDPEMGNIVPQTAVDKTKNENASLPATTPPILDEMAIERAMLQDSQQNANGSGTINPQQPQQNVIVGSGGQAAEGNNFPTGVATTQNQNNEKANVQSINTINKPKMDLSDMKEYLNGIKKDIVVGDGFFTYNGKIYKAGDQLDALSVVSIEKVAITFASDNNIEYSLRFVGGN